MNVELPLRMDRAAFLDWVQRQEERYELDRGCVIMMTGGSREHWQITANLLQALTSRLDADRFMVLPEFGVDLGPQSMRFPDVVVDVVGKTRGDLKATAPVMIVEVLSPSSERVDLGDKAAEYLRLPSLTVYLVLAQDQMKAWLWSRGTTGFPAGPDVLEGHDATIQVATLGLDLPLSEIFARVKLA